jgi:hypothetical protein
MTTPTKFLTDTRITGLFYLGLAITGVISFLAIKNNLYVEGNAALTHSNILQNMSLARAGVVIELLLVAFQAMAAIWFYKLFNKVDSFASVMLMAFGLVNAIAILISSSAWWVAINVVKGNEILAYYFFNLHESIWLVASLFFGLWLIPMGLLATKAKISHILGVILIIGGIGYILSAMVLVLFPEQKGLGEMMTLPATIGEFWMIGYLLVKPKLNTES